VVKGNPEATGKITTNKRFLQPKHPTNKVSDKSGVYSKSPKVANAVIRALLHTPRKSKIVILLAAVLPLLHNEALPQHATVRCHSEVEHITGRKIGRR
jgi:hypothetical protein